MNYKLTNELYNGLSAKKLEEYYRSSINCRRVDFSEEQKENEIFMKDIVSVYIKEGIEERVKPVTNMTKEKFAFVIAESDLKEWIIHRYFALSRNLSEWMQELDRNIAYRDKGL